MAELFATGRIVDGIVAFMALELIVLIIVRKKTGRGVRTRALIGMLGAGAALLLSLRAALTGHAWQEIAGWLVAALIAHLLDLRLRWSNA